MLMFLAYRFLKRTIFALPFWWYFSSHILIVGVRGFFVVNTINPSNNLVANRRHQSSGNLEPPEPEIPEENPYADQSRVSKSGVAYKNVLNTLHELLPPENLEERNAISRSDGYWPFIKEGGEPPLALTYGEFDFFFFAEILDMIADEDNTNENYWNDKVFVDIGSGVGRLVFAAAALHPGWRECRGIEILPGLHDKAQESLDSMLLRGAGSDNNYGEKALIDDLAPIYFVCGSFEDPGVPLDDANCIFVTASCMPKEVLTSLRESVLQRCRPGTFVISTDYSIIDDQQQSYSTSASKLELLKKVDGWSWVTGGDSTAYIQRIVSS